MTIIEQNRNKASEVSKNADYRVSSDLSTLILQRGAHSEDVALLQEQLVALKYMKPSDISGGGLGHYGPKTAAAVRLLQEDLNKFPEQKQCPLQVNGIMDPRSREKLNSSIEKYGFNGKNKQSLVAHGPAPDPKPAPEPQFAPPPKPAPEVKIAPSPKPAPEPAVASEPSPAPEPIPAPVRKKA